MLSALEDLERFLAEADLPYDGIIGFSHGACLAATFLLRAQIAGKRPFKVAVFLSAGMAADPAGLLHDRVQVLESQQAECMIDIPTAHIFADNDQLSPGQGDLLFNACTPSNRHLAVHKLGHQMPGPTEQQDVEKAAMAIKGAIFHYESIEWDVCLT